MAEYFFHIGMHKTASTFLQQRVFPKLQGIHFVPKRDYARARRTIRDSGHARVLLSDECQVSTHAKIDSLQAAFPEARVIIVVRRHDRWAASKYKYYVRKGGTLSPERFFGFDGDPVFDVTQFDFVATLRYVEERFGRPPFVVLQEELQVAPEESIRLIAAHLGARIDLSSVNMSRVNAAYSDRQLRALLAFNRRWRKPAVRPPGNLRRKLRPRRLLRYLVPMLAQFGRKEPGLQPVVPTDLLARIRERYRDNWQGTLDYVRAQRPLPDGIE